PEGGVAVAGRAAVPLGAEENVATRLGDRRRRGRPPSGESRDRALARQLAPAVRGERAPGEPTLARREQTAVEGDVAHVQTAQQPVRSRQPFAAAERLEPQGERRGILRRERRVAARPLPLRL